MDKFLQVIKNNQGTIKKVLIGTGIVVGLKIVGTAILKALNAEEEETQDETETAEETADVE